MKYVVAILKSAYTLVLAAVGTMLLWNWFAVEIFSLPKLNLWESFGLSILVGWFTTKFNYEDFINAIEEDDYTNLQLVYHTIVFVLAITFGWAIHQNI